MSAIDPVPGVPMVRVLDEDGVANETFCAVAVIAAQLIVEDEDDER